MDALKELFDAYGRNARLYPALLLTIPLLTWPSVFNGLEKLSSGIATGIVCVALFYGLTHGVRALGKRAEPRLVKKWGGLPTTRHLLWKDTTLDPTTKRRYHKFFKANGLDMPSREEELANEAKSQEKIASAVTWLRNNRRADQFKILNGENAAYGFRRNLYGVKPLGIAIALIAAVFDIWPVIEFVSKHPAADLGVILNLMDSNVRIGFVVSIASLIAWIAIVTPNWVRSAAEQYAKALLETCDAGT